MGNVQLIFTLGNAQSIREHDTYIYCFTKHGTWNIPINIIFIKYCLFDRKKRYCVSACVLFSVCCIGVLVCVCLIKKGMYNKCVHALTIYLLHKCVIDKWIRNSCTYASTATPPPVPCRTIRPQHVYNMCVCMCRMTSTHTRPVRAYDIKV